MEQLESRQLLAQLYVITHGLQFDGSFPDWIYSMAEAIDRRDNNISTNPTAIRNSRVGINVTPNPNGSQNFLLFDWVALSGIPNMADEPEVAGVLTSLVNERLRNWATITRTIIIWG
jgi:hypothetical protein